MRCSPWEAFPLTSQLTIGLHALMWQPGFFISTGGLKTRLKPRHSCTQTCRDNASIQLHRCALILWCGRRLKTRAYSGNAAASSEKEELPGWRVWLRKQTTPSLADRCGSHDPLCCPCSDLTPQIDKREDVISREDNSSLLLYLKRSDMFP